MHPFNLRNPTRIFTPPDYLKFIKSKSNRESVVKVKFLPPKLGSSGFGKVYVELKFTPKGFRTKF